MKLSLTIILTLLLTLSLSHASNGSEIFKARPRSQCEDLNPEMGQWFQENYSRSLQNPPEAPIERILGPVKKQKVGWCFAFASADMLSHEVGYNISAAYVAKTYYDHSKLAWIMGREEGGVIEDALEISLDRPLCEEAGFPSKDIINYTMTKNKSCMRALARLKGYHVKSYKAQGHFDGFRLFGKLDEILGDGRIAGIQYEGEQLSEDKKPNSGQTPDDHASTVVSRYFDKKESACRYIIRNSYGKGCLANRTKNTKCLGGYYSVTEEQLNAMLREVVSLERKD